MTMRCQISATVTMTPLLQQEPVHVLETSISSGQFDIECTATTCNVRGLKQKVEQIAMRGNFVTGLQETDVDESNVHSLRKQATALCFTLCFAELINMSKEGDSRYGRRAALVICGPAVPFDITIKSNPTCAFFRTSGRWVERLIPTGKGRHHMIVACLYGYPGARGCNTT